MADTVERKRPPDLEETDGHKDKRPIPPPAILAENAPPVNPAGCRLSTWDSNQAKTPDNTTTLGDLIADIRGGTWQGPVGAVRAYMTAGEAKLAEAAKDTLPCVTPAGTFTTRDGKTLVDQRGMVHSGLVVVDLDYLGSEAAAAEVRDAAARSPHCAAAFISPRGQAVKAFFTVTPTPHDHETHRAAFAEVDKYCREYWPDLPAKTFDTGGSHPCRLCYTSFDPGAYLAETVTPLTVTVPQTAAPPREVPPGAPAGKKLTTSASAYGRAALEGECAKVAAAAVGTRNKTLNDAAFAVGQLVAGGKLSEGEARADLERAAAACGLEPRETEATIRSGLTAGKLEPRRAPDRPHRQTDLGGGLSVTLPDIDKQLMDFNCTDSGNAEVFAHLFGELVRYDHARGRWLVFSDHRWQPDPLGQLTLFAKAAARARYFAAAAADNDLARKWGFSSESDSRIRAALSLARSEPPIADRGSGWDHDPLLLGVTNGVIDLTTGDLREGQPADRITKQAACAFDPAATCPRWLSFLDEVFEGDAELIEFVRLAVGYSLTGLNREQVFFFLYGSGSNGKSVFTGALRELWGGYGKDTPFSTFELNARSSIPSDLAALAGARFITASETSERARMNEARIKAFTGESLVTARQLYKEEFSFVPEGKLWLSGNHRPEITDDSDAFWRRVRLIPFDRQFTGSEVDPELPAKLRQEQPGILAWAVGGAVAYLRAGRLPLPDRVKAETESYRETTDPLADFLRDRCVKGATLQVPAAAVFAAYEDWCESEGLPAKVRLTFYAFGARMKQRFGAERTRLEGKQVRIYTGIGLASEREV